MKNINNKYNHVRNLKIVAINNERKSGFSLYLDFSGQREFLMYRRHNGLVYNIFKDGISLNELSRITKYPKQSKVGKRSDHNKKKKHNATLNAVNHILSTVDIYLEERMAS